MAPYVARPWRTVNESARERETFRYHTSLLSSMRYSHDGEPLPSSELTTSHDTILTALAQLAVCQTGTARALISLFDQEHQFVIAEATPRLPLAPDLRHKDQNGEDLWLCGTAIPRAQGACEHTLCSNDGSSNEDSKLPLVLVRDLHADGRFRSRPYCRPGTPAKFYAGVPIRSRRDINIGVLCVLSPHPVEWNDHKTEVMRNLSRTIMERLEATKAKAANRRGERMNRGIGSFVEGKSTVTGWKLGPNAGAYKDNVRFEGALNAKQQDLCQQEGSPTAGPGGTDDRSFPFPQMAPSVHFDSPAPTITTGTGRRLSQDTMNSIKEPTIQHIFSSATNIIRESLEVEGCLFLDAAVGSFRPAENNSPAKGYSKRGGNVRSEGMSSSSDEGQHTDSSLSPDDDPQSKCGVLGFSTTELSSIDGEQSSLPHGSMQEKFLSGLLRRYPKGHIFVFGAEGELQTSDSSEDASSEGSQSAESPLVRPRAPLLAPPTPEPSDRGVSLSTGLQRKVTGQGNEGAHLLRAFPGARSIAFVPVWDSRKDRWCAGGFIYTLKPNRVFTTEGDLSYLRAFGTLAMAETLRCETLISEKAKTDALGSLSHEMRSPLHGIVLGVELMRDTDLSVFQGNITHTIETCCRTLIDTVDHLLDYSKINNFHSTRRRQEHAMTPRGLRQGSTKSIHAGMKSLSSNVRLDALAEEVIESVFAGFNFQHISIAQLSKEKPSRPADISANRRMDAMKAMEELDPSRLATGEVKLKFGDASIFLVVDPGTSWAFFTESGAIRRIIMNLFGNSLKHTHQGTIRITLKQSELKRSNERLVQITIADTGRGISQDYLRNELFKPFSQEDSLAPGSGLGLSIVKKITSSLRGRITVTSVVDVGTTVTVALPLALPSPDARLVETDDEVEFNQQRDQLRGLRIRLLGFDENRTGDSEESDAATKDEELNGHRLIRQICRDWLHMEVISGLQAEHLAPDLVLMSEDALPPARVSDVLTKPPCIVVCANALVAYQQSTAPESASRSGVFEFISQPVGPRKLAKILLLASDRWIAKQVTVPIADETMSPLTAGTAAFGTMRDKPKPAAPTVSVLPIMDKPLQSPPGFILSPPTEYPSFGTVVVPAEVVEGSAYPFPKPKADKHQYLLVDDNPINLKILSSYMHKLGLAYQTATNGQEAVDKFVQDPARFRCIFMDISMPVMDGFQATRLIRAYEAGMAAGPRTPASIFALSGLASASAQQEALWSGIDLFLTKPVKLKELGSILRSRGLLEAV